MDFNKITSDLKFLGCTIRELNVVNTVVSLSDEVTKKFGMDVAASEISVSEKMRSGKLLLKIVVELEENSKNIGSIDLVLEGAFSASISVDEDAFKELLLLNGATALFSIGRSKIENISATTFLNGKIIIPMINIYDYYMEKQLNATNDNKQE